MKHNTSTYTSSHAKARRVADRVATELPIDLNGTAGLTRNISATGIYFEAQVNQEPGSVIQFFVDVEVQGEKFKMVCKGEVVRVEQKDGVMGVAVKLSNSFFTDPD